MNCAECQGFLPNYSLATKRYDQSSAKLIAIREFAGATVVAGEGRGIFVPAPRFSESATAAEQTAEKRGVFKYIDLASPKKPIEVRRPAAQKTDGRAAT